MWLPWRTKLSLGNHALGNHKRWLIATEKLPCVPKISDILFLFSIFHILFLVLDFFFVESVAHSSISFAFLVPRKHRIDFYQA